MSGSSAHHHPHHTRRAWKLQEFVAHAANVNCLALGHKSGRVLVTGGDDKKVNLWAVGKPNCIMSLCGHTTPIECVRFGHTEELVCAGSQSGALKIWDLEAARLVRTLTGHKAGLTCIDFHPYGDFLASGSADTNLKLWDTRRKGCIFTYKGHSQRVNSLKFSPDGQWIASAGDEGSVKIWDLRAGKLMTEFADHGGPVHDVEFHPHEFLLASASHDRTVNFWDLESFQLVSTSERDSGPVRCITFHPESECLFSASHDSFKVHLWEPHRVCDSILMGWGKIRDIAVASTQLIGAAHQMSNVSIFVVDLKRVQPLGSSNGKKVGEALGSRDKTLSGAAAFKSGQHVRRSFVREKPGPNGERSNMKISEENASDEKSGTDPEDSDAQSAADINDYNSYEHIFKPRRRELNRTPTRLLDEPFEAPSGSESETPVAASAAKPVANLKVPAAAKRNAATAARKKPSPSPTRRSSQPAMPTGYCSSPDLVGAATGGRSGNAANTRLRRSSNSARPVSSVLYEPSSSPPASGGLANGTSPPRYQRATSVQPRSALDWDVHRNGNGDVSPPIQDHSRAHSLGRPAVGAPAAVPSSSSPQVHQQITPLTPVSRIQIGGAGGPPDRPLDRPTLVRPNRTSVQHEQVQPVQSSSPPVMLHQQQQYFDQFPHHQQQMPPQPLGRQSQPDLTQISYLGSPRKKLQQEQCAAVPVQEAEKDKFEVIPMNLEKPSGIELEEFLPKGHSLSSSYSPHQEYSRFSAYKDFGPQTEPSESEVTSTILKGHESMITVLTRRGRNLEIIHKLWQNKDAKAAVDQAVSLSDQAVLVDLLSVITLRPSIWNLDLCTALLPPIGDLLQSKYEMYINTGCGAMKLILKNFASVIKSNIDSPIQTVGVDISREERHNKCMQCYKDLVKIRALILKRQTMQGKLGHTYRELSILMQYLD